MKNIGNKFVMNEAFPIKICYLKDEEKNEVQETSQHPSLAYLSSIIQSQKKRSSSQKHSEMIQIKNIVSFSDKGKQFLLTQKPMREKNPLHSYNIWKQTKNRNKSEEKPFLTNLLGSSWEKGSGQYKRLNFRKKIKKKNHPLDSYDEKERKRKNDQLLNDQFNQFIQNKQSKHDILEEQQKLKTNKPDSLKTCPQDLILMKNDEKTVRPSYLYRVAKYPQKPKTSDTSRKKSIVERMNFKPVSNFQWSRVSDHNSFSLQ